MKLYPPIIKGTIPAFCDGVIKVPFEMNKSVSISQVRGFSLLLKTVQTNTKIGDYSHAKWEIENNIVTFEISNEKINIGQFYKLQLAYVGWDGIVGHYSTVGIIKCTSSPIVEIETQDEKTFNGLYKQTQDFTEKVYSYNFSLFDSSENLIETSGDLLHNSSKDADLNQSVDSYTIKKELEPNIIYYLKYSIKTINGLEKEAKAKKVVRSLSIDSKLRTDVRCFMIAEEGYVDVNLAKPEEDLNEASATGSFYLLRASNEDNFSSWSEVLKFVLYGQQPSRHLWKDMTVKQGVTYRYAVQQYNSEGLRSNKIISNDVYVDFEHAFLYDGERQLKIKYNPKVSSFKNTLLESKTETIGSKYPFIFRNGNVSYKEFPISGLISYLSDENKLFFNTKTDTFYDVNLTSQNLYLERQFKLEVLNWLNNGKPKLFRSPGEGNYIVRLMNNSLSPIDSTGRMLHTFNCTAYEIAENNYDNLKLYDFVNVNDPTTPQLRWLSVDLSTVNNIESTNLLKYDASSIRLEGMVPGDKVAITMSDQTTQSFVIGATGSYIIDLNNNVLITSLELQSSPSNANVRNQGILTYSYYSTNFKDSFDTVVGLNIKQVPCQQFIGEYENIIDEINNFKEHLGSIVYLKFILRDAETEVYQKINEDGTIRYYSDSFRTNLIDLTDTTSIYKVYDKYERGWDKTSYYWMDGYNNKRLDLINANGEKISHSKVVINNNEYDIDLEDTLVFELKNPKNIISIKTGSAVICEIGYQSTIISYNLESVPYANQETIEAKENYNDSLTVLQNAISNSQTTRLELKTYQDNCKEAFNNYCKVLDLAVQEAERR